MVLYRRPAALLTSLPAAAAVTSTTSTSSSTLAPDFFCRVDFHLYDAVELSELRLEIGGGDGCTSPIPGVTIETTWDPGPILILRNFPPTFRGPGPILTCSEHYPHFFCSPTPDRFWVDVRQATGPDGPLATLPAVCLSKLECSRWPCDTGPYGADVCGDPDRNHFVGASDALHVLRATVSLSPCALTMCDADRSGDITASDALRVLRVAVGIATPLLCPPPCQNGPEPEDVP